MSYIIFHDVNEINNSSKFLISSSYIRIWKDIFKKASLICAWILVHGYTVLVCHVHPKFCFGESKGNVPLLRIITLPTSVLIAGQAETRPEENRIRCLKSLWGVWCAPQSSDLSVQLVVFWVSAKVRHMVEWKPSFGKIYCFHGRHETAPFPGRSRWVCCLPQGVVRCLQVTKDFSTEPRILRMGA